MDDTYVCPNGHEMPAIVTVHCADCPAAVTYEPTGHGMRIHGAALEVIAAWDEYTRRPAYRGNGATASLGEAIVALRAAVGG